MATTNGNPPLSHTFSHVKLPPRAGERIISNLKMPKTMGHMTNKHSSGKRRQIYRKPSDIYSYSKNYPPQNHNNSPNMGEITEILNNSLYHVKVVMCNIINDSIINRIFGEQQETYDDKYKNIVNTYKDLYCLRENKPNCNWLTLLKLRTLNDDWMYITSEFTKNKQENNEDNSEENNEGYDIEFIDSLIEPKLTTTQWKLYKQLSQLEEVHRIWTNNKDKIINNNGTSNINDDDIETLKKFKELINDKDLKTYYLNFYSYSVTKQNEDYHEDMYKFIDGVTESLQKLIEALETQSVTEIHLGGGPPNGGTSRTSKQSGPKANFDILKKTMEELRVANGFGIDEVCINKSMPYYLNIKKYLIDTVQPILKKDKDAGNIDKIDKIDLDPIKKDYDILVKNKSDLKSTCTFDTSVTSIMKLYEIVNTIYKDNGKWILPLSFYEVEINDMISVFKNNDENLLSFIATLKNNTIEFKGGGKSKPKRKRSTKQRKRSTKGKSRKQKKRRSTKRH